MPISRYETIQAIFAKLPRDPNHPAAKLHQRWHQWVERFEIYNHVTQEKYTGFFRIQRDKKMIMQEEKLLLALRALEDIYTNKNINPVDLKKMEEIVLAEADIEISKIEIRQARKLKKIQNLDRTSLSNDIATLKEKRKQLRKEIKEGKYSQLAKGDQNLVNLHRFLDYHEQKFHFSSIVDPADYIATGARIADRGTATFSLTNFIAKLVSSIGTPLVTLSTAALAALNSIPVIANIITAIPTTISAVKAWLQNKSRRKTALTTVAAVAGIVGAIASIVLLGVGTATIGIFIATGLAALGYVVGAVIPWVRKRMEISKIDNEHEQIIKRVELLENRTSDKLTEAEKISLTTLTENEKNILLKEIEESCLRHKIPAKDPNLLGAISLICNDPDISKINEHPFIKGVLSGKNVNDYLIEKQHKQSSFLVEHLQTLRADANDKQIRLINSGFAVLGLILLCIPTPPTIIIGSILLTVTTLVGIGIKYNWGPKISDFFSSLFNKKTEPPTADATTSNQKLNVLTADKSFAEKAKPAPLPEKKPEIAPDTSLKAKPPAVDKENDLNRGNRPINKFPR